jgi:putative peptidoglycan lipid II flippase
MVKGFRQIAILTVVSRVLGFIRDMAFAYFLGAGALFDGWAIAFKIPNLARRLFGEGAAASSFIPVYSEELHNRPESANKVACTVVTAVAVLLACVVLVGEGIIWGYYTFFSKYPSTDLKLELAGIMLPYMILICIVAIFAGILQTHRHFAAPAAAPLILNIFIIGSLVFSGWVLSIRPDRQVFVVAVAVLIAGLTQLGTQLLPLHNRGIQIRPAWQVHSEAFRKIVVLMAPMILGMTATQINTLADDFTALWLSGSAEKGDHFLLLGRQIQYPMWAGAVSHLYYSQRLYQFPLGVLGISLATAIFPVMSADAARRDTAALLKTTSRGLRGAIFIALPATAGMILISQIIVRAAFQHGAFSRTDTVITSIVLSFYALGLCGYFLQQIVTRAFYAVQDSKMPAQTAGMAVLVNVILNLTLVWSMGAAGLALSTAICSYLQVTVLLLLLTKRYHVVNYRAIGITLAKTVAATVAMYLAGAAILKLLDHWPTTVAYDVLRLVVVIVPSASLYVLLAVLLKTEMLGLLSGKKTD